MSAEKRSVHTDALQTLGTIITEGGRDAIHLAVEPVVAGEQLRPGEHVGLVDGKAYSVVYKHLGIVDPFLVQSVMPGEKFWLIVYPRQITSLRHVWEHPDFPDEGVTHEKLEIARLVANRLNGHSQWIKDFALELNMTPEELMAAAELWITSEEYTYENTEAYKNHYDKMQEFWDRYEAETGKKVPDDKRGNFFTCSC